MGACFSRIKVKRSSNGKGRSKRNRRAPNNPYPSLSTSPFGLCPYCNLPNTDKSQNDTDGWCHSCNSTRFEKRFNRWTSNNAVIDDFIKESQINAMNSRQVFEWIPYETLHDVELIAQGGFNCKVYSANWLTGNILYWDSKSKDWARKSPVPVALKRFENSRNITADFFDELKTYRLYGGHDHDGMIECYGITQDPDTNDYILVTEFAARGNLRNYLMKSSQPLDWERKINMLLKISMTLQDIHSSGFVHRNIHGGNVLHIDKTTPKISDVALSKHVDPSKNRKLYGVLPYIAPEILRKEEFTPAADVYSFSMIMWEVSSGVPPFCNRAHDFRLAIDICSGTRPRVVYGTPKSFSTLMERCWNADPLLRPSVQEITAMLFRWHFHLEQNRSTDICNAFMTSQDEDMVAATINKKFHPNAKYNSQLLDFKDLPEPTNYFSRVLHDSAFGSLANTSSSRVASSLGSRNDSNNSLSTFGNSEETCYTQTRKSSTYVDSLRKKYQYDVNCFYYAEPESFLDDEDQLNRSKTVNSTSTIENQENNDEEVLDEQIDESMQIDEESKQVDEESKQVDEEPKQVDEEPKQVDEKPKPIYIPKKINIPKQIGIPKQIDTTIIREPICTA